MRLIWLAQKVYGFVANREYHRWRAARRSQDAWYYQQDSDSPLSPAPSPHTGLMPAGPPANGHPLFEVDTQQYYAPAPSPPVSATPPAAPSRPAPIVPPSTPRPSPTIDINMCTADELVASTGVDSSLANAVIAARNSRRAGFDSVDDLARTLSLQPHQLVRFQSNRVVFGRKLINPSLPNAPHSPNVNNLPPQQPPSGRGRILDY